MKYQQLSDLRILVHIMIACQTICIVYLESIIPSLITFSI